MSAYAHTGYFSDGSVRPVSISDYPALEKVSDMAIKDKQKFERLVVSKEKLLEMFAVWSLPLSRLDLRVDTLMMPSTTNTKYTLSNPKSLMARRRRYIAVGPWSISALDLIFLILGVSRRLW